MKQSGSGPRWLDWLAGGAALLAVTSCYGLLLLVGGLSLIGITLAVHDGAWVGVVTFFALLSLAGMLPGYLRYRSPGPIVLALAGACLITVVMLVRYNWMAEVAGFAALLTATAWDWRLKRPLRQREDLNAGHHA